MLVVLCHFFERKICGCVNWKIDHKKLDRGGRVIALTSNKFQSIFTNRLPCTI